MLPILIHVPHSSLYIPEEYRRMSLLSQTALEEENLFLCDTGVTELISPALAGNAVIFPYSRLYCDVERFRDGTEPMEAYGMGFIYTRDSRGREIFRPGESHYAEVSRVYERHHARLHELTEKILREHGRCFIIDLHSFSDAAVERMFGFSDCPDVCIGTEPGHECEALAVAVERLCAGLGLSAARNYPYKGSLVPEKYYREKDPAVVSLMLEINKRVLPEAIPQACDAMV